MDPLRLTLQFTPDRNALLRRLRLDADSDEADAFTALLDRLAPLGRPKAAAVRAPVEAAYPKTGRVVVGGTEFESRFLAARLGDAAEVYPHVATCGTELDDAVQALSGVLDKFWGGEIMAAALDQAREALLRRLERDRRIGPFAVLGPGSHPDWPLEQQEPLFRLLADAARFAGVVLTPAMLMLPAKSLSGILFPADAIREDCTLCPRRQCPDRRAPYDPGVAPGP